jgi:hypothetical protein
MFLAKHPKTKLQVQVLARGAIESGKAHKKQGERTKADHKEHTAATNALAGRVAAVKAHEKGNGIQGIQDNAHLKYYRQSFKLCGKVEHGATQNNVAGAKHSTNYYRALVAALTQVAQAAQPAEKSWGHNGKHSHDEPRPPEHGTYGLGHGCLRERPNNRCR